MVCQSGKASHKVYKESSTSESIILSVHFIIILLNEMLALQKKPEPEKPKEPEKKKEEAKPKEPEKKPEPEKPKEAEKKPEPAKPKEPEKKPELEKPKEEPKPKAKEPEKPKEEAKKPEPKKPAEEKKAPPKPEEAKKPKEEPKVQYLKTPKILVVLFLKSMYDLSTFLLPSALMVMYICMYLIVNTPFYFFILFECFACWTLHAFLSFELVCLHK